MTTNRVTGVLTGVLITALIQSRRKKTDKGRMTLGKVQKEYRENDVCMGELLDALPADGLSIEEAFELAITAKKWADGDRFYRSINDGEPEEL